MSKMFYVLILIALCGIHVQSETVTYATPKPLKIDMNCQPLDKFSQCPHGYCCVRDEFLPTYVYCKAIGTAGEHCTTRDTDSECPCDKGLYCKPNIISGSFQSLYGVCHKRIGNVG
ncbi:hypothetical protein LOTGIDRAFT_232682 [Lottia gigantea]|uniref:Prokineticin domain-containing protein n=1 Tax=Lottia gigantea TaxID=225164 RepID=V4AIE4_LOTGI|nr:hypothetical protein LOTGIDRAFT_232682 [Lottia gigantea]ESO93231.1 hypothetical protein LOTGIDRAFT_232682 [Lottia gigantea]